MQPLRLKDAVIQGSYTTLLDALTKYQATHSKSLRKLKKTHNNNINNTSSNRPNLKQSKTSLIYYMG